jgi:predicted RNA-binding protein YlqC (UPF0109 family)
LTDRDRGRDGGRRGRDDRPRRRDGDDGAEALAELAAYVVRNLVDTPDEVEVEVDRGGPDTTLSIRVDPEDRGRVIGREGRVIDAIRTVVDAARKGPDRIRLDVPD